MRQTNVINIVEFIVGILFALLVCSLAGCGHPKVVVAPEVHKEAKTDSTARADVVQKWDSVYVSHVEKIAGDTVLIRDTVFRYKTIDVVREVEKVVTHDVEVEKPYPVEVVKEVRVRNGYDKFTARGFWLLLLGVLLMITGRVAIWYIRSRR